MREFGATVYAFPSRTRVPDLFLARIYCRLVFPPRRRWLRWRELSRGAFLNCLIRQLGPRLVDRSKSTLSIARRAISASPARDWIPDSKLRMWRPLAPALTSAFDRANL